MFGFTSKGSIVGQLQRALTKRDVLAVRSLAGELPSVPLPIAAEITLLLLEGEPESYAPAARRLLAGLASERAMPLHSSRMWPRSWPSLRLISPLRSQGRN